MPPTAFESRQQWNESGYRRQELGPPGSEGTTSDSLPLLGQSLHVMACKRLGGEVGEVSHTSTLETFSRGGIKVLCCLWCLTWLPSPGGWTSSAPGRPCRRTPARHTGTGCGWARAPVDGRSAGVPAGNPAGPAPSPSQRRDAGGGERERDKRWRQTQACRYTHSDGKPLDGSVTLHIKWI